MNNATMVYRPNGGELLHGFMVDYQVIDADDVEDALNDGWFLTPTLAGESVKPVVKEVIPDDSAPPTRAELEAKATELEIKFDGRTSDKKLGDLIAATLES